ncbi:MAG: hypothetical protein ACOCX1_05880 [Fimbriimonadaceae bacterium]
MILALAALAAQTSSPAVITTDSLAQFYVRFEQPVQVESVDASLAGRGGTFELLVVPDAGGSDPQGFASNYVLEVADGLSELKALEGETIEVHLKGVRELLNEGEAGDPWPTQTLTLELPIDEEAPRVSAARPLSYGTAGGYQLAFSEPMQLRDAWNNHHRDAKPHEDEIDALNYSKEAVQLVIEYQNETGETVPGFLHSTQCFWPSDVAEEELLFKPQWQGYGEKLACSRDYGWYLVRPTVELPAGGWVLSVSGGVDDSGKPLVPFSTSFRVD